GLGLPLGLIAWAGWGLAGVDLFHRWRSRLRMNHQVEKAEPAEAEGAGHQAAGQPLDVRFHLHSGPLLLVWAWGSGYFLYQGTQWVKSMRYLLPVYPAFVLLAAWLVVRLVSGSGAHSLKRKAVGVAVAALALVGALLWASALTSVYARPHTRIAASHWIFENVPSAATAHLRVAGDDTRVQITLPPGIIVASGTPATAPFRVDQEADLTRVTLNYVVDPGGDPEPEVVRVAVATDAEGQTVLAEATVAINPPPPAAAEQGHRGKLSAFPLEPTRLLPGTTYYLVVEVMDGGPVQLFTSVLATEHWDWAPPLRVDGHDPFGGMYQNLSTSSDGTLQLYHDDTAEKRENLLNWLDEADYIIVGSNRIYASISRLPTRYPLTIAYYHALFNGELGFELVADFTSYPALGPFHFPDTEEPFPLPEALYQYRAAPVSVPLPPAEEAFSVYDHPRVLVFRKTDAYSRQRAQAALPLSLLNHVVWVTPRQATRGVREPVFDPETWAEQQAGGTWSEMFSRQSLLNHAHGLAALAWHLAVAVLGWLAFPLLFAALPCLSDRGYGLARALGLLVVAYLTWLSASLRVLPNTRGTVILALLLLAVAGGMAAWRQRRPLRDFLRRQWTMVLVYEGLFLVLFAAWAWVRTLNPDLWHPVVGGEKPMDFAYLNAVIKSTWFPPYDPWFAGGYINYYYFGFVLVGSLAKLLGIMPSIAYNLALALFYALTGGAAFSVAFNLVGRDETSRRAYVAGFLAVLFVLVLGNLGEVRLLVNGFRILAGEPTFQSTIPGLAELVQTLRGLGMALRGAPLPFRPETPYWDPTRMIPADASGVGPITEFPAFTFLYGDPHAHMLALPYTLLALALALNWARGKGQRQALSLLIGGLVIGSLRAINTWDYPTYLLLGLAGLASGRASSGRGSSGRGSSGRASSGRDSSGQASSGQGSSGRASVPAPHGGSPLHSLLLGAGLVALTVVLFLPYSRNYIAGYTRLQVWRGPRTPLDIYLLLVGQFLFPLFTLLAGDAWRAVRRMWRAESNGQGPSQSARLRLPLALGAVGLLLFSLALALLGMPIAIVVLPAITLAAGLVLETDSPLERRMVWLLLALALAISLAVEVVVLEGDIGRMNTVFKFYIQVWTSLAVGAAAALVWLAERLRHWSADARQMWWAAMGTLIAAMALFPLMSIPAKVKDRLTQATGPTLDGMAYMEYSRTWDVKGEVDLGPDYRAIVWMQENIEGSPVVLEGLGVREYLWGNRVSVYTGLPTVIGWRWHQVQQRMAAGAGEVEERHVDVNECYETPDIARAWEILERYGVRYVYIGPYERLYYDQRGLAKFGAMDGLRPIYNRDGVRIYEVR
ncbi:MAG TPA: hypothetical protein ENI39_07525, partial [Anaerolineae bacterium]|nr:hypothetical protein [Anaerolineae bacterium]